MHTFLIMNKKLGSELLPTSHLIRVLWQSCQQCSTGRQELQRALAQPSVITSDVCWAASEGPERNIAILRLVLDFLLPFYPPACSQGGCEWGAVSGWEGRWHGQPLTPGASPPQQVQGWYLQQSWSILPAPSQGF